MPRFFGTHHAETFQSLSEDWLEFGSPVCFIQGFPGVGKRKVAEKLIEHLENTDWIVPNIIDMPNSQTNSLNDLCLTISEELSLCDEETLSRAIERGHSPKKALERLLSKQKVSIIIDEFHRAFIDGSNQLIDSVHDFLQKINRSSTIHGRVLILTSKLIDESESWANNYEIKTLDCLLVHEAEELLEIILSERKRSEEVPDERRKDVVHFLGCNQRAMEVFVGSLRRDPLDYLIGKNPEIWQAKNREISKEFLYKLEKNLLEQTLSHFSLETITFLKYISVYRKPVQRKALEILISDRKNRKKLFESYRDKLIDTFILEHHSGIYRLHPVAKEISLKLLNEKLQELRQVHYKASEYYTRHFAKPDSFRHENPAKRGGKFVESRYHLVQAGKESDLKLIAYVFEKHLLQTIVSEQKIPQLRNELNEIIAVCLALRESLNSKYVEYYLAKLLKARGKSEDLKQALIHTRLATEFTASYKYWIFRIDLELQVNGIEAAIQIARNSLDSVSVDNKCFRLYLHYADLLIRINEQKQAILLLQEGIERIPVNKGLVQLYHRCAELLAKQNNLGEAISLLQKGIKILPENQKLLLYQDCVKLLAKDNKLPEAINLV
ncbi:MAG: AAA family ATPase [Cyanobacteria bacterium P01_G01_bin.39]